MLNPFTISDIHTLNNHLLQFIFLQCRLKPHPSSVTPPPLSAHQLECFIIYNHGRILKQWRLKSLTSPQSLSEPNTQEPDRLWSIRNLFSISLLYYWSVCVPVYKCVCVCTCLWVCVQHCVYVCTCVWVCVCECFPTWRLCDSSEHTFCLNVNDILTNRNFKIKTDHKTKLQKYKHWVWMAEVM